MRTGIGSRDGDRNAAQSCSKFSLASLEAAAL
jgi:hypothetical protein